MKKFFEMVFLAWLGLTVAFGILLIVGLLISDFFA